MNNDDTQSQKKRGRPATGTSFSVGVRLPPAELERLDAWRRTEADLPTRPEAIRRLIKRALNTNQ